MGKVRYFQKMKNKLKIAPDGHKKFSFQLGSKGTFTYTYRKPFIPLLYWNGDSLRYVVSPTREWVDPICSICTKYTSKNNFESVIDVSKFAELANDSLGESRMKRAIKNVLNQNGVNVEAKEVLSAERFIKKALAKKEINLDDLANQYGLKPNNTKMRKDIDKILEDSKIVKSDTIPPNTEHGDVVNEKTA